MLFKLVTLLILVTTSIADSGRSGCGSYGILTKQTGFIKSHRNHGQNNYGNNRDCSWNILAPTGYRIRLDFIGGINLEEHNNCAYDYLSLFDGDDWNAKELGTWCGSGHIPTILSSGSDLYLEFVSDEDATSQGFKIKYEFFRETDTGCHSDEYSCSKSKCIPASWRCDGEEDCWNGKDEESCQLTGKCKSDEFQCYNKQCIDQLWECDGEYDCLDNSDEIGCSTHCRAHDYICKDGSCLNPNWVCDGDNDCGDNSDEKGCRSVSRCYSDQFECSNRRCIPSDYQCDTDNDCGDNSDELNCMVTTLPSTTPGVTTIPLRTVNSTTPQSSEDSGCGNAANMTGADGTFTTKNFPSVYEPQSNCVWKITVAEGEKVYLEFTDFHLESGSFEAGAGSRNCKYDYVSIYNDRPSIHNLIGRYCGTNKPSAIVSHGNSLVVQFLSDNTLNKKGFNAKWKAVASGSVNSTKNVDGVNLADSGCGSPRELTGLSGVIHSHTANGAYNASECVWSIGGRPGVVAQLKFNFFELEDNDRCHFDYLKVYIGSNEQSSLAGTYCGSTLPDPIVSRVGFYLVFKSDHISNYRGFNISYKLVPEKTTPAPTTSTTSTTTKPTGGRITTPKAITTTRPSQKTTINSNIPDSGCGTPSMITQPMTIFSKGYGSGKDYESNLNCTWTVTAPAGQLVRVHYADFRLEHHSSCGYDDISIYEGRNSNGPLLKRSCSDTKPRDVISSTNQIFIQFLSDDDTGYEGFKAQISFFKEPTTCKPGQFTCLNGNCISEKRVCDSQNDCEDDSDETVCYTGMNDCGKPSDKYPTKPGNTRVYGGTDVNAHSWPWQAMLMFDYDFICGATLVHPQWIVTAAHCFENKSKRPSLWKIILGKHNTGYESSQLKMSVSKVVEYPHYNQRTTDSDLAMLKLSTPVKFVDEIKPICLPTNVKLAEQTACYVTGWGSTKGTGNSGVLKQASVPLISRNTCNRKQWYDGDVTENMFCAGYPTGGHDGCDGDSGGPLSCEVGNRFILEGVVSWGVGCGLPKTPGVYTRVPNFVEWIKNTIKKG